MNFILCFFNIVEIELSALNLVNVKEISVFKKLLRLASWRNDEACFIFNYDAVFLVGPLRGDYRLSANQYILIWKKIVHGWLYVPYLCYDITCLFFSQGAERAHGGVDMLFICRMLSINL